MKRRGGWPLVPLAQAEAELRAAGYELTGEFTGRANVSLDVRCLVCGQPRRLTLSAARAVVRYGGRCSHFRVRSSEEDVRRELEAAGLALEGPWHGKVMGALSLRCLVCGQPRKYRLNCVRNGVRCRHKGTSHARVPAGEAGEKGPAVGQANRP